MHFFCLILFFIFLTNCSTSFFSEKALVTKPIVIGHRGAPGYLPEHTLEGYSLAIDMGADFIEPDLVSTKDGVLIARHENEISETTDVEQKFPKRKTTKTVDGKKITGWFTEDFTLKEIKKLRAKERLPNRSQANNGKFLIPTFVEIVEFVKRKEKEKQRPIGIYPETKHPSYFQSVRLALEPRLIAILNKYKLNQKGALVFIQSFEVKNLKELKNKVSVPLVQLIDELNIKPYDFVLSGDPRTYKDLVADSGLREISTYASGIGPWKQSILEDPDIIKRTHSAGLLVHPYTFRSDKEILPAKYKGNSTLEYEEFFKLGVDGLFSDFTDHAIRARGEFFL